jgi:uncharacterized membrane protein YkvA (DUF1232 family)
VIRRLADKHARRRGQKPLSVVYLCSNSEIAEQNRTKLVADADPAVRRVSQLAVHGRAHGADVHLYSFTPGTSLSASTGIAWERRLILYLLGRAMGFDIGRKAWRTYFRCGVAPDRWENATRLRALASDFQRRTTRDFQARLASVWRTATIDHDGARSELRKVLPDLVHAYDDEDRASRDTRNRVIRTLRAALQQVALDHIEADLVILDEVQRFKEVLDAEAAESSLERRLFANPKTRVLILSATPYKLLTLDHEEHEVGGGHYEDFLRTLRFLFAGDEPVRRIERNLADFRARLQEGHLLKGPDPELRALKETLQHDLKKVMSRTERNWYVEDLQKGIEEVLPRAGGAEPVGVEELEEFIRLRRLLGAEVPSSVQITEFWKSAPAVLTFMDQGYAVMRHLRGQSVPGELVAQSQDVPFLGRRSHRFRTVARRIGSTRGDGSRAPWLFLWVRPSYTYYRDDFYGEEDPSKLLVFSSWRFVPKAVSILLSAEIEATIVRARGESDTQPLRFAEQDGAPAFHVFDLCFPSPCLADVARVSRWSAGANTDVRDFVSRAEQELERLLTSRGIAVGETRQGPLWQVVARLEAKGPDGGAAVRRALGEAKIRGRGGEALGAFDAYREQWLEWLSDERTELRVSRAGLNRLARIALFSPSTSLLRALWDALPPTHGKLPVELVEICLTDLRSYFNRALVRRVVDGHHAAVKPISGVDGDRAFYTDRVLRYTRDAHLQAVLDEYLTFRGESVRASNPSDVGEFLRVLGHVFALSAGTPRTNGVRKRGTKVTLVPDEVQHSVHFALAFGDSGDSHDDEESPTSGNGRRTAVREAFNSPFWPFVLATTSVGQEGLDFHLFCRDIVHWNLPWNPVDLEQREGRINRRNCLALRRSIAAEWPLTRVAKAGVLPDMPIWKQVFTAVSEGDDRQRYKRGLFPKWIFDTTDPSRRVRIRRHLPFHPMSNDAARYGTLKDRLAMYRLVFGQPRQQDLLEHLEQRLDEEHGPESVDILRRMAAYMINLSPFPARYARDRAGLDATKLLGSPSVNAALGRLLEKVMETRAANSSALEPASAALDGLVDTALRYLEGGSVGRHDLHRAVAALLYLINPFDDVFDLYSAEGFIDDIDVIQKASVTLISTSSKKRPPSLIRA